MEKEKMNFEACLASAQDFLFFARTCLIHEGKLHEKIDLYNKLFDIEKELSIIELANGIVSI